MNNHTSPLAETAQANTAQPATSQSSTSQSSTSQAVTPRTTARTLARTAALVAAVFLLANMVLAIVAPGQMGDHATAAGRLSEGLVGLSFIAGAAALLPLLPQPATARWFWLLGIAGLAASGLTMLAVFATTLEPPFQLFLAEVAVTAPALVGIAVSGVRRGNWPWWVGLGIALLLPIMFLLPLNSMIMAIVWIVAAWQLRTGK